MGSLFQTRDAMDEKETFEQQHEQGCFEPSEGEQDLMRMCLLGKSYHSQLYRLICSFHLPELLGHVARSSGFFSVLL